MYCTKCGSQNPDGATFCANCGQALSGAQSTGQDVRGGESPLHEHHEKASGQTPVAPLKRGLPGWAWVLIGCGGFAIIVIVGLTIFGFSIANKISEQFGGMGGIEAAVELEAIQTGMKIYMDEKDEYPDFPALKDSGYISGLTFTSIEAERAETELAVYELTLRDDGDGFNLTCTAKKADQSWEIDENSGSVFTEALGFGTSSGS